MVNQNVLCCIEVKLHHLNPLKNDFQTKLGISSVLLPEEGFHHWRSLWAVVALYQPLKRKEKKILQASYLGCRTWGETEMKYHLQSIWETPKANWWGLVFAGDKLSLISTHSKQSNWQTAERLDMCLPIHKGLVLHVFLVLQTLSLNTSKLPTAMVMGTQWDIYYCNSWKSQGFFGKHG